MEHLQEDLSFLSAERQCDRFRYTRTVITEAFNRTFQRLPRWRTGRSLVVYISCFFALGCMVMLVMLLPSTPFSDRAALPVSATRPPEKAQHALCSVARLNPNEIQPPIAPDIAIITSIWPEIKEALVEHGKGLPSLDHPVYQHKAPSKNSISRRTKLLSQEQAFTIRNRHAGFVESIPPYPQHTFKGRGVVMLAGGHYSEYAALALGVLRETGSILPVEVWHRDEREEKDGWCDEMKREGMACRRLSDYLDIDLLDIKDGKEMKAFTMLFSSFEEFVFIDADNAAIQRPEVLLDSEAYRQTGAILWPDYWKYDNIDWLDYAVGLTQDRSPDLWNTTTYESGQVVWNKRLHWDALVLATYYNYYGPELYYTLLNHGYAGWGDKDTFPLALRALNKTFYTIPSPPETFWIKGKVNERRGGMLQMGVLARQGKQGKPLAAFMHATTVKWSHRDFVCDRCLPIWHTNGLGDGF